MSKSILVGYDPRRADRTPVAFGVAAARFTGAPLIVASVQSGQSDEPSTTRDPDLMADCTAILDQLEADLRDTGVPIECRKLESTSAARALHDAAGQLDAGLLVVGSSNRSKVGQVLPGSTAERLLHGAPCPVAVVPHDWSASDGGPKLIGTGFVDTEEGREALRGAHALAARAGATLRVITVVELEFEFYSETEPRLPDRRGKDLIDVEGEHMLWARRKAEAAVAELGGDVPVEVEAFLGAPAEQLAAVSEHLDLLVCGSRGYGPLRAVLLGSVSRRLMAEARCPVILLPRGVRASLESLVQEAAAPA
jgi:nucleotide-binding universal stress UspA family protein